MKVMDSDMDALWPSAPRRWSWVGGENVPTLGGSRVNASEPLAELSICASIVELRLRGPFARLARAETLRAVRQDLESAFPIRSKVRFRGVGFRRVDGREYYFKTTKADEILAVLDQQGLPVSMTAQPAAKLWSGVP